MTRRERIDEILTAHNSAIESMAAARTETRNAHRHLVDALHAMLDDWASAHDAATASAEAQDLATNAVLEANRAALALLREDQP